MSSEPPGLTWRWVVAVQLAVALAVAALCAAVVRAGCVDPGPPVDMPSPGTPRAGYCSAVDGGTPWLQFVAAPGALLAVALLALRRRPAYGWVSVGIVVAACVANAIYMHSLPFVDTI